MKIKKILLCLCAITLHTVTSNLLDRTKRNIGIFNVVKFKNDVCEGTNNQMGTCFTTEECENASGEASGSCAEGYGVCCTFSVNCGGKSSQNNTVFMSNNPEAGECAATICPIDDTISQLRLEFTTFAIADPSASTAGDIALRRGTIDPLNQLVVAHTTAGQCLTDSFVATSPGSSASDVLCGTNSGTHLYIDASENCNSLMFILGTIGATPPSWSITVQQYAEDHPNLAPTGCDQYHFDNDDTEGTPTSVGTVQSFNFNNGDGRHLANQDQTICIRREAGMSRVCFSQAGTAITNDFRISSGGAMGSIAAMGMAFVGKFSGMSSGFCGNYGTSGTRFDFDYLHIPKAKVNIGASFLNIVGNSNFCGHALFAKGGTALTTTGAMTMLAGPAALTTTMAGTLPNIGIATICTTGRPFRIRFVTDGFEVAGKEAGGAVDQNGFSLGYLQS